MDASLSGDYRPLMLFINGLERDKMFFLVRGVTLTGSRAERWVCGWGWRRICGLRLSDGEERVVTPSGDAAGKRLVCGWR